jgi:hypothetical protein
MREHRKESYRKLSGKFPPVKISGNFPSLVTMHTQSLQHDDVVCLTTVQRPRLGLNSEVRCLFVQVVKLVHSYLRSVVSMVHIAELN